MEGFFVTGTDYYYDFKQGQFVAGDAAAAATAKSLGSCSTHKTTHIVADLTDLRAEWSDGTVECP
jgi:hypothetical protein